MSDGEPVLHAYWVQFNDGRQDRAEIREAATEDVIRGVLRLEGNEVFGINRVPSKDCPNASWLGCAGRTSCPRKGLLHCQKQI